MHGFNQGRSYLSSLCADFDIIFVQLADISKTKSLKQTASSAMDDVISRDCLNCRPFGGVGPNNIYIYIHAYRNAWQLGQYL